MSLRGRGVNYDTGFFGTSRPEFDLSVVRRELEIVARDLHCNAVRISGQDPERISAAAECAAEQGLEIWFAPFPVDVEAPGLLELFADCAARAERLRRDGADVTLVLGCELSLFAPGFIPGRTTHDRIAEFASPEPSPALREAHRALPDTLDPLLAGAAGAAREAFAGRITYAAGKWEPVDWSRFDVVSVDLYREGTDTDAYREKLRSYLAVGKPVAVTEFGCCTFRGASAKGGLGWMIADESTDPWRIRGEYERDEAEQAQLLRELLGLFAEEGVDSAFWYTFANFDHPHRDDPVLDLDLASYGLVKILDGRTGSAYPGLGWEPKEAFRALADVYAAMHEAAPAT